MGLKINFSKRKNYLNTEIISKLNTYTPGINLVDTSLLHLLYATVFDEFLPGFVEANIQNCENV